MRLFCGLRCCCRWPNGKGTALGTWTTVAPWVIRCTVLWASIARTRKGAPRSVTPLLLSLSLYMTHARRLLASPSRLALIVLLTQAMSKNFTFFGAPVGLIFTLDKEMGPPQWSDVGMFMQSFMLLARERGLHTCPQVRL